MKKPFAPKAEEKPIEAPSTDEVTIKPVVKEPPVVTDSQPPAVVKPVAVKPVPVATEPAKPLQPAAAPAVVKPAIGKSASAEPAKTTVGGSNTKEASKSFEMKLDYRDDQWSPNRPEGKKVYTSNFLLQFRNLDIALSKPSNLPPGIEDIILNQPIKTRHDVSSTPFNDLYMGDSGRSDFTPNYMSGGHHGHGGGGRGGSRGPGRHGPGRQPSMTKPNKVIKLPVREKVPELKKTDNAWKPKTAEELDETAEVLRAVRSILNKLTPQKFQNLMQQVQTLAINTEERLRGVINLIFEKAIDEPNFCEAYANMCRVMSSNQIRVEKGQQQPVLEFRKILLTRCQKEFEKAGSNEAKLQKLRVEYENAAEDKKEELKMALDEATNKERRRTLGNIRFIGELFKLSMLTETIMHNCILQLFRARTDEDSLESLCRLLTTIGKDLDHEKGKSRMDQYFNQMRKIISEKKVSSRVRFMLQDVIDLRLNRWTPRAVQNQGPKTIDQIHADAEKEKELEKARTAQVSIAASKSQEIQFKPVQSRGGGSRMGSRGNQHNEDSGGWNKVPQKPVRYDPQKMKLSKTQFDESKVTLGPNRGGKGWKSGSGSGTRTGSSGGGYSSSSSREHLDTSNPTSRASTPTMINRFSALAGSNADQTSPYMARKTNSRERVGGPRNSREKATSRDRRTPSKDRNRTPPLNRGSMERKSSLSSGRQDLIETTRRMTMNEERKQSPSPHSNRSSAPAKSGITMDMTSASKKVKSIIKEYMSIVDVKEAIACYTEEMDHSFAYLFIQLAMEESLERKTQDRTNIAKLLSEVVKSSTISIESYIKGVSNIMTDAVDLEIDLPKIWSCLAELIGPVLAQNSKVLGLNCLLELTKPLMEFEKAHVFVAEIILNLLKDLDKSTIQQEWARSNLQWSFFCDDKSYVKDYLDRKNLLFLMDATPDPTLEIRARLSEMLVRDHEVSNEEMFAFIEKTYKAEEISSPTFVRALTAAICHHAISKMMSNDEKQGTENGKNIIKSRTLLFKKYVDGDSNELQAVYALQKLNHELDSPPNTLRHIFDLLYDEEVISEHTFFSWEKDQNPEESEGKGVALLSVKPFFTWLREAEPDEADD